jgi:putative tryptophan/tyrosine transport system substrate-binding protein
MNRRFVLALVAVAAALHPLAAPAQQSAAVPRLCMLVFDPGNLESGISGRYNPFFQGLRDFGYVHPRTIRIEYLSAEGRNDRFPALAAECVRSRSDVIVVATTPAAQAAKRATSSIPIVMHPLGDPVGTGLVKSLSQPGGNVTGLSQMAPLVSAKRLELLKDAFPRSSHVLVPTFLTDAVARGQIEEMSKAAQRLGIKLFIREIKTPDDYAPAFEAAVKAGVDSVMPTSESISYVNRKLLIGLAAKYRLPAVYWRAEFADAGGLMSFSGISDEQNGRTAYYVDRVLKGAKPSHLPIEQPSKFSLVVNLKAARELGLVIPAAIQMRADKVVQ